MKPEKHGAAAELKALFNKAATIYDKYSPQNFWLALKPPHWIDPPEIPQSERPSDWLPSPIEHPYLFKGEVHFADVTVSPARNPDGTTSQSPKGTFLFCPGWKTKDLEKKEHIEFFQNNGFTVLTLPLVESERRVGTMEENIERYKSAIFDKNSPIRTYAEDLPFLVITHSTAATVFEHAEERAMLDYNGQHHFAKPADDVSASNPFLNPKGASKITDPIKSRIHKRHAMKHHDEYAGESLLDRLFYYASGLMDRYKNEHLNSRPTHGQTLEISGYGDILLAKEHYDFARGSRAPITVYNSANDDFSNAKVSEMYYRVKGAKIHPHVMGGHDSLQVPEVKNDILTRANIIAEKYHRKRWQEARLNDLHEPPPEPIPEPEVNPAAGMNPDEFFDMTPLIDRLAEKEINPDPTPDP